MNVIEATDLKKSYGTTRAVDGISFSVQAGEIFGLLGPNGAGKTTTVSILQGLRRADGGLRVYLPAPNHAGGPAWSFLGSETDHNDIPAAVTYQVTESTP